jgi:hypothetical protein
VEVKAELTAETAPAPKPAAPVTSAKVDGWKYEDDKLTCYVYEVQQRKTKKGGEMIVVKHNGQINGKDVAFCFQEHLFEALLTCKGHRCLFFADAGDYVQLNDIIEIEGVEYRDGKPYKPEAKQEPLPIGDNDIPF